MPGHEGNKTNENDGMDTTSSNNVDPTDDDQTTNDVSQTVTEDLSVGQSQLTKLKTGDGRIISSKTQVLEEVEKFYGQLYTTTRLPVSDLAKDPRARLIRHNTEDIPDVSLYEIRMAPKQLKNNKAPGDDGITAELLNAEYNFLDSKLDELNTALDFLEQKNDDIHERLKELLQSNIDIRKELKVESSEVTAKVIKE